MKNKDLTYLSIVIPAYNEEENFKKGVLESVNQFIKKQSKTVEVLIVDDGSTDDTTRLVKEWIKDKTRWKLIRNSHKGKAQTVKTGVLNSKGKLILFTDFDQATPISEIEKLFPFLEKGYDVAIGSREVKGSKRLDEPWYRHLMGRGFNLLVNLLALRGIHDTQCGFKLFTKKAAFNLFESMRVYSDTEEKEAFTGAFDVEILYLAQKKGYKIAEVPVHWKHIETSRVNPIRDSMRMFFDLIKIRITDLTGKYGKK